MKKHMMMWPRRMRQRKLKNEMEKRGLRPALFLSLIMRPKTYNLDGLFFLENLINKTMLKIDSSGVKTLEVSNQLFVRRRSLKWIFTNNIDKSFGL